jgi:O-antigen/teichoic acid export membrane protein
MDQGLSSGAGFVLNLFLARWLDREAYGAFAVAFATLLFLFGFHTALLLEPMSVVGPSTHSGRMIGYFLAQLRLHCVLTVLLSGVLLVTAAIIAAAGGHAKLVAATAGSALALPFLLLLWMVRRMCYVVLRPSLALWGSAGYLLFIALGLVVLHGSHLLGPFSAFVLMGTASIPAALFPLWQLGVISVNTESFSWREALQENWSYGRWLIAGTILFAFANQAQTYIVAGLMGLGAAGILRALQIPSLVMTQIVTAFGLLVLPSLATEFGLGHIHRLRKKAVLTTIFLTVASVMNAAILWTAAKPIEQLLYGGKFSSYSWLIPTLGLVPVFTGFAMGFSMALRACQKPHFDLLANAVAAPVGLATAFLFIRAWGLGGAVVSLILGYAAYAAVLFASFVNWTAPTAKTGAVGEI